MDKNQERERTPQKQETKVKQKGPKIYACPREQKSAQGVCKNPQCTMIHKNPQSVAFSKDTLPDMHKKGMLKQEQKQAFQESLVKHDVLFKQDVDDEECLLGVYEIEQHLYYELTDKKINKIELKESEGRKLIESIELKGLEIEQGHIQGDNYVGITGGEGKKSLVYGNFKNLKEINQISDAIEGDIKSICVYQDYIFIAQQGEISLVVFKGNNLDSERSEKMQNENINCLHLVKDKFLYLGTQEKGLFIWDLENNSLVKQFDNLKKVQNIYCNGEFVLVFTEKEEYVSNLNIIVNNEEIFENLEKPHLLEHQQILSLSSYLKQNMFLLGNSRKLNKYCLQNTLAEIVVSKNEENNGFKVETRGRGLVCERKIKQILPIKDQDQVILIDGDEMGLQQLKLIKITQNL